METSKLVSWFNVSLEMGKEQSLLLLDDGHLTHISILVIKATLKGDVVILKCPPHITDKLKPLDVVCFGPLKKNLGSTASKKSQQI